MLTEQYNKYSVRTEIASDREICGQTGSVANPSGGPGDHSYPFLRPVKTKKKLDTKKIATEGGHRRTNL